MLSLSDLNVARIKTRRQFPDTSQEITRCLLFVDDHERSHPGPYPHNPTAIRCTFRVRRARVQMALYCLSTSLYVALTGQKEKLTGSIPDFEKEAYLLLALGGFILVSIIGISYNKRKASSW